jgi:hypothetical protein
MPVSDWSADMTEKQLHSDLDDEDAMTTSNLLQNCPGSSGVFQESVITGLCHLSIRKILTDPNTPPCHPNTHILFSPSVGVLGSKGEVSYGEGLKVTEGQGWIQTLKLFLWKDRGKDGKGDRVMT